jgi:hypothetical protein
VELFGHAPELATFTFACAMWRNVETIYASVKSQDVPITRELQHENWPARGFNLKDPSGNEVHIEQPT